MTRLNIGYQGFKIGARVGDQWALGVNVNSKLDQAGLHALAGIVNLEYNSRALGMCAVNGKGYATIKGGSI